MTICIVMPNAVGSWDVVAPGAERFTSRHAARQEAIERAQDIVRVGGGGKVHILGLRGEIVQQISVPGEVTEPLEEPPRAAPQPRGLANLHARRQQPAREEPPRKDAPVAGQHKALMAAYRQAIDEANRTNPVTAAVVVHDIIASCRAVADRLRVLGGDDKEALAKNSEDFAAALSRKDYIAKGRTYLNLLFAALGIGAGAVLGLVFDALGALFATGALATTAVLQGLIPPIVLVWVLRAAPSAWASLREAFQGNTEADLYTRIVGPIESAFFAHVGGGKPAFRPTEIFAIGSAVTGGLVLGAFAAGVVIVLLQQ